MSVKNFKKWILINDDFHLCKTCIAAFGYNEQKEQFCFVMKGSSTLSYLPVRKEDYILIEKYIGVGDEIGSKEADS